jgi:hypothetical protein
VAPWPPSQMRLEAGVDGELRARLAATFFPAHPWAYWRNRVSVTRKRHCQSRPSQTPCTPFPIPPRSRSQTRPPRLMRLAQALEPGLWCPRSVRPQRAAVRCHLLSLGCAGKHARPPKHPHEHRLSAVSAMQSDMLSTGETLSFSPSTNPSMTDESLSGNVKPHLGKPPVGGHATGAPAASCPIGDGKAQRHLGIREPKRTPLSSSSEDETREVRGKGTGRPRARPTSANSTSTPRPSSKRESPRPAERERSPRRPSEPKDGDPSSDEAKETRTRTPDRERSPRRSLSAAGSHGAKPPSTPRSGKIAKTAFYDMATPKGLRSPGRSSRGTTSRAGSTPARSASVNKAVHPKVDEREVADTPLGKPQTGKGSVADTPRPERVPRPHRPQQDLRMPPKPFFPTGRSPSPRLRDGRRRGRDRSPPALTPLAAEFECYTYKLSECGKYEIIGR